MSLEALFILFLILVIYVYAGYPLCTVVLARIVPKPVQVADIEPSVTILISAYNEAEHIGATIENKLQLGYPSDKLKIIVISDGSTDGTDDIVSAYAGERLQLLRQEPRQGKTAALNMAVKHADGEILVFSDANSIYRRDAISYLVRNFADPQVGYVTGNMLYTYPDGSPIGTGCSAYMRYENYIRMQESRFNSIVGVDGGIDAMRLSLYRPMNADQLPDFVQPLNVVEQGYRVIYEPKAVLNEPALDDQGSEYRMRVRVSLRSLWAMLDKRNLLNPLRYPVFSWQLLSHKLLRYMAWIPLLGLLLLNPLLAASAGFYEIMLYLQLLLYLSASVGYAMRNRGTTLFIFSAAYYFILVNLASAHAGLRFLQGQKQVLWTPRTG